MTATKLNDVSFEDANGVGIKIPADQLNIYSVVKAHQLHVVARILSDHAAGFNVELDDDDIMALTGIASDLSAICKETVYALASIAFPSEIPAPRVLAGEKSKGGA